MKRKRKPPTKPAETGQMSLLGRIPEPWEKEWQDMPEFIQEDQGPFFTMKVHFANKEDLAAFAELVQQTITLKSKSIWYPKLEWKTQVDKRYIDTEEE